MTSHVPRTLLVALALYTTSYVATNQNETDSSTDWMEAEFPAEEEKEESQIVGAPSELIVTATHDSVQVSWLPPRDDNVLIRGYLIGWGINLPDVEKATVEPEVRHFTIRGLKPNREYVISLRAFNNIGQGFPIYETVKTSSYGVHSSSVSSSGPKSTFGGFGVQHLASNTNGLSVPVGVVAEAISSSQIRLSWIDPNENAFNQIYTIKYGISNTDETQHKLLNSSETEHSFDGLRPDTLYEFAVRLAQSSHWSLNALNRTFPAPPSSPPRDLTIIGPLFAGQQEDTDPGMVTITWQPPKYANGQIQEYIVLYSDRPDLPDREWVMDSVKGDRLSIAVRNLRPSLTYNFKLQARNVKGYGPFTPVTSFTTADTFPSRPTLNNPRHSVNTGSNSDAFEILLAQFFSGMRSNMAFVLIGIVIAVVVLLLFIALFAVCFQHNKNGTAAASAAANRSQQKSNKKERNKRAKHQQQAYIPGRKMSVSTPSAVAELDDDLWLVHQQRNSANPGARFATLVNTSNGDGYGATTGDDETSILLIDGQQRAFFASANATGSNFQSAAMEGITPKHYQQQQAYHAATQRHGIAFVAGSSSSPQLPRGLMESFHSMTTVGESPKDGNKKCNLQRNSLPPHICPSNSTAMSPPFTINKCSQRHQYCQLNVHAHNQSTDRFGAIGRTKRIAAEVNFGRRSDSPFGSCSPCHQRVAGLRMHSSGHISSLNALDLSISPRFDHALQQTNGLDLKKEVASFKSTIDPLWNKSNEREGLVPQQQYLRVGIGLPSMPLQIKQARRTTTANYEATTAAARRHAAPVKSVNFASKLVIVSSDDDDDYSKCGRTKRRWKKKEKGEEEVLLTGHERAGNAGNENEYGIVDIENQQKKGTETANDAHIKKLSDCNCGLKFLLPPSSDDMSMDSVGTLPRGHSNRYHHHNSSASLEMNSAPQPLHIHQQQQHGGQQQQHLGGTPLTPRNSHVVYTRVDRQPVAKMDFSMNGSALSSGVIAPPLTHDSPHNQQRHQFCPVSVAGGTPPPPLPPPSLATANRCASTKTNAAQHNRNDSDGYQTVGGRANAGGTMISFADGTTVENASGEQLENTHQQQRMAHIVRPIVYAGSGIAGGASPSPSTLRSAIGQPQAQKTTPTSAHKFVYNNNGAKVPIGRATVQPRVNLAVATNSQSSNVITTPYGCSSSSQYASVRLNPSIAANDAKNVIVEHGESEAKVIESTEDLQEIDQMIETLQQLQHDFTGGDNASAS